MEKTVRNQYPAQAQSVHICRLMMSCGSAKAMICALLLSLFAMQSRADDYKYPYLVYQTSDGTEQSMSVNDLKMTISGGSLVVVNSSTNQTFTLAQLAKMYFSSTSTGINDVTVEAESAVEVYNLSGVKMGDFANEEAAKSALAKGVYVVKGKTTSHKIAVK